MKEPFYNQLSPHLFWDVSKDDIDPVDNKPFIIKRVLEYGTWLDWQLTLDFYGLEDIVETAKKIRELDPRSLSFLSNLSSTALDQFQCYTTKQSTPKHAIF